MKSSLMNNKRKKGKCSNRRWLKNGTAFNFPADGRISRVDKGEKLALVFKTCELDDAGAFSTLLVFVLLSRVLVLDLDLDVARHLELRDHGVCEEWGARPDQLLA